MSKNGNKKLAMITITNLNIIALNRKLEESLDYGMEGYLYLMPIKTELNMCENEMIKISVDINMKFDMRKHVCISKKK